jgi:hypothetical protein
MSMYCQNDAAVRHPGSLVCAEQRFDFEHRVFRQQCRFENFPGRFLAEAPGARTRIAVASVHQQDAFHTGSR